MKIISIVLTALFLSSCFSDKNEDKVVGIELGKTTFLNNCAQCHGINAIGMTKNWKKPVNGVFPPPPLNGSAHTWHHSPKLLLKVINEGGTKIGGVMPSFENRLNEVEKQSIIKYLFSLWPKEIQDKYTERFGKI